MKASWHGFIVAFGFSFLVTGCGNGVIEWEKEQRVPDGGVVQDASEDAESGGETDAGVSEGSDSEDGAAAGEGNDDQGESCVDECGAVGQRRCSAAGNSVEVCGEKDGDGCLEWFVYATCGSNETCDSGECVATCTDQCIDGERRCTGNSGYDTCRDSDSDGCLDWGMHVDCPAGMVCDPAAIRCVEQQQEQFEVEWLDFGPLNDYSDPGWGNVLTDIVRHCPAEWVQTYWDSDKVTHGHETTHGINSYLRNYENSTGQRANGFYVLENRAAIIVEPGIWKHQAAEFVPAELRGDRFDMYVTGQTAWDDAPLYLFDEWTAYTNGTAVAVDLYEAGAWNYGWRDACMGTIEFVVYSVALAMAVEKYDPNYFSGYEQFKAFLGWQLERSVELFRRCSKMEPFAWDRQDRYFAALRGTAGEPLRQFLGRVFGTDWVDDLLAP
ncbi:MAG: hypothetical protein D6806_11530 [Deltaproteobacteria bacterium]|nr:MAG: hypothetical protein D6806_11530 [Deltaproteobacteria bacterium]